jgi:hypothetical protein
MPMEIKKYILLLLPLFFFGCSEEHQRDIYHPSEKDSLEFLVSNSDVIGVIEIYDGVKGSGSTTSTVLTNSANAKIIDLLKGKLNKNSVINISNTTLHKKPGGIKTLLTLRNGEYIAFLASAGKTFKPLTPYSLIEIFSISKQGRPIWKQTESKYMDRPNTQKDEIIKEIKDVIESGSRGSFSPSPHTT